MKKTAKTQEKSYRYARDMIYLVSCAVNEKTPDVKFVRDMDLERVYRTASRHMLASAASFALESAGVKDPRFEEARWRAIRRVALMDAEMERIFARMDEAGIWHMPLKGTVIKNLYPKFGMRDMSDHDILFDAKRAEDLRTIMEDQGFSTESFGASSHDVYHKMPVCNFEMHRFLFGSEHDDNLFEYYRNVEERLTGAGCEKHFSPEDFYVYMIAHEYKHFSGGGTGVRSLLDTYVYLKKKNPDITLIERETEKLGIADFEKRNRSLSLHLFGEGRLTAEDKEMLKYILSSGVYGTITHHVENKMKKNEWGKLHYMLDRFFVPVSRRNKQYNAYAGTYPLFYKYKLLLPLLPFYRTFRAMGNGRFKSEAQAIRNAGKR